MEIAGACNGSRFRYHVCASVEGTLLYNVYALLQVFPGALRTGRCTASLVNVEEG